MSYIGIQVKQLVWAYIDPKEFTNILGVKTHSASQLKVGVHSNQTIGFVIAVGCDRILKPTHQIRLYSSLGQILHVYPAFLKEITKKESIRLGLARGVAFDISGEESNYVAFSDVSMLGTSVGRYIRQIGRCFGAEDIKI